MFGVAVLLSILGNLSHGQAAQLSWQGMVGAGVAPVLLALASHQVVVVWRRAVAPRRVASEPAAAMQAYVNVEHMTLQQTQPTPVSVAGPRVETVPEPAEVLPAVTAEPAPVPPLEAPRPRQRTRSGAPRGSSQLSRARGMYTAGKDCAEIAKVLGTSKRTAERWTADLRAKDGEVATS
jgi:hypothetical protein